MTEAPFWSRARHLDRRPALLARARIAAAVRAWFTEQGFIEVEPSALVGCPGGEVHLQAVRADGGFLHTSPEFAMKKLLAAGEEKIFFLGKVWRAGERGPLHAPEFTMLEWYRAHADYGAVQADCLALAQLAVAAAGADALRWRGRSADPALPARRLTVAQAFAAFAGVDLLACVAPDGEADRASMAAAAQRVGVRVAAEETWGDIFSRLLVQRVEPRLADLGLVVLDSYPAPEAALARRSPADRRVAERFELYACGVELANGFGELTDPAEQRTRLEAAMAEKARRYGAAWPIDEDFLAALAQCPPAAGCALGFDRLVALAVNAPSLAHVLWTPDPD